MRYELSRGRVSGFLHADGMTIRNGQEEPVLLLGWGLGNWMLCEGYMWGMGDVPRFDRPRRMERILDELMGQKYTARFWKKFRENYISRKDLEQMAEMGYNSLRVPINARLFLSEEPGIHFREEGFRLLDWLVDTCEKVGLYVWIDLHGAPGGQTGANIDDSEDDLCRLLIDEVQFQRGVALWEEISRRYKARWIVAGYDLLNEPIRPVRFPGDPDLDGYEPRLKEFYEAAIRAIRAQGDRHLVSLEGKHWAADLSVFDHVYDDQMVLHFHRYGVAPEMESLQPYLDAARRLNVPLWLGETGENTPTWMSAMIPLALSNGIHVTLWPWKKMMTDNSPCSYRKPEGWDQLKSYLQGGTRPDNESCTRMLEELLRNIQAEECAVNTDLLPHILRRPGCFLQGTDFDEGACHAESAHEPGCYRKNSGMEILPAPDSDQKQFVFDGPWRGATLRLREGEWAEYTFWDVTSTCSLEAAVRSEGASRIAVSQGDRVMGEFDLSACDYDQIISGMHPFTAEKCTLRLRVLSGSVIIRHLSLQLTQVT